MTAFMLKLLAVALMTIDHVGAALIRAGAGDFFWMRVMGRLAFPLFAFMVAQGCVHSRDIKRYMARLGLFALVAQPCYWLFHRFIQGEWVLESNVMLTLALGVAAVFCWQRAWLGPRQVLWAVLMVATVAASALMQSEFAPLGTIAILLFYILRPKAEGDADAAMPGNAILSVLGGMTCLIAAAIALGYTSHPALLLGVMSAAVPMLLYEGKPGPRAGKWVFYLYYPAHLLALGLVLLLRLS